MMKRCIQTRYFSENIHVQSIAPEPQSVAPSFNIKKFENLACDNRLHKHGNRLSLVKNAILPKSVAKTLMMQPVVSKVQPIFVIKKYENWLKHLIQNHVSSKDITKTLDDL